jgi:mannose/fructose/N-acetylgalactosamine-specific phosphotransferase system component IIB
VSRSVYLSAGEREQLHDMGRHGMQIVIQAVPNEKPQALA